MAPASIQEDWLEVDGVRIHYLKAGESGSAVVLLHGGGIDSALLSWGEAIKTLSGHHRIFAPDLPGYGLSDVPDIQYTTDFYVNFLVRLLDKLHLERVSLVGLSMGGAMALSFTFCRIVGTGRSAKSRKNSTVLLKRSYPEGAV